MTAFAPKLYQSQRLESVESYFRACHELGSPAQAYTATTERLWGFGNPYNPLRGFPPDMPYFCLRVPTSGRRCRFVMVRDKRWDWIEDQL